MKLLYHPHGSTKAVSPFDTAIMAAASGQAVRLVCPYIGLSYLQRILAQCSGWQLITDVREWCGSAGSREVGPLLAFLGENVDQVRHLEGVHAKTVIGGRAAYLGSANLTHAGILARTELGVSVAQPELLAELREWFDGLWASADALQDHDLAQLRAWHAQGAAGGRDFAERGIPKVGRSALRPVAIHDGHASERAPQPVPTQAVQGSATAEHAQPVPESDAVTVVEGFIDRRAAHGFTVEEVRRALVNAGHDMTAQGIESLLLQYRANHPATVFEPDTVNRLVFANGAYRQSTAERFKQDVQRFDVYLVALIDALDLRESRAVPSFEHLQESGAFTAMELGPLPAQLRRAGMLLDDGPGMRLNPSWEWKGRFQVYEQARTRWMHKQAQGRFAQAPVAVVAARPVPAPVPAPVPDQSDALVDAIMAATARQTEPPSEALPPELVALLGPTMEPQAPEESHALRNHTVAGWMDRKLSDATIDSVYMMVLDLKESGKLNFHSSRDLAYFIGQKMRLDFELVEAAFFLHKQDKYPLFEMTSWNAGLNVLVRPKSCDGSRFPKTKGRLTRMAAEAKVSAEQRQRKAKFIGAYRVTADEAKRQARRDKKAKTTYGPNPNPEVEAAYKEERAKILQSLAENDRRDKPVNRHTRVKRRKMLTLKLNALKPPGIRVIKP